jgi:hypothetical protein
MAAPQHEPTALGHVVELNEGAKEIAWHSRELSLRALGATAQSLRAGTNLRGFVEVSGLMQSWCTTLGRAVATLAEQSRRQVHLVSDITRRARLHDKLARAADGPKASPELARAVSEAEGELRQKRHELRRVRDALLEVVDDLRQLGLTASVLSRAALIEAAGAEASLRTELTYIAQEFARGAEKVSEIVRQIRSHVRGVDL